MQNFPKKLLGVVCALFQIECSQAGALVVFEVKAWWKVFPNTGGGLWGITVLVGFWAGGVEFLHTWQRAMRFGKWRVLQYLLQCGKICLFNNTQFVEKLQHVWYNLHK